MTLHQLPIRIYYADTDAGGVVYHARYLELAERARTEMLRAAGFEHAKLAREQNIVFAVVSLAIDYKLPARLDDLLVVHSSVVRLGGASMDMEQVFYRDDKIICEIKLTLVSVDPNLKAVRLPQELRDLFKSGT